MKRQCTIEYKLLPEQVEILDLQTFEIIQAWQQSGDSTDLRALARSCYLQGLIDGVRPEVAAELSQLKGFAQVARSAQVVNDLHKWSDSAQVADCAL